jgi:MtN3 and saliva related transmembrane protein
VKEVIAWLFGLGLLGNALLFVPQLVAVARKRSAEGVSLVTFGGFSVLQVVGILHGVLQKDGSLIFGMSASLVTCGSLTLLAAYYRLSKKSEVKQG